MKKLYFATICFVPPVCVLLFPVVFLFRLPFPVGAFPYLIIYVWIGLIVLLVDLWRSRLPTDRKIIWTALNLILGIVTLPIYWFLVIQKKPSQSSQQTRGS